MQPNRVGAIRKGRRRPFHGRIDQRHPRSIASFSNMLALAALLISMLSLYITSFQVSHSLRLIVSQLSVGTGSDYPQKVHVDVVVANNGNRTETLVKLELHLGSSPGAYWSLLLNDPGPYILKAQEAVSIPLDATLEKSIRQDMQQAINPDNGNPVEVGDITLVATLLDPEGKVLKNDIHLGTLIYSTMSEVVNFKYDRATRLRAVNLFERARDLARPSMPASHSGSTVSP